MSLFRPCIDLHDGKVKQIVGSTLSDSGEGLKTNFVADRSPAWFAGLYRKDNSEEKLLILFNPTAHTLQAETGQEHAVDFETGKPFPAGSDISAGDFKILKIN